MAQPVTAYEDNAGNLHKTRIAAIHSEFISMVQKAWGKAPDVRDRGDPVVIARFLISPNYTARAALLEALLFLEENLKESP